MSYELSRQHLGSNLKRSLQPQVYLQPGRGSLRNPPALLSSHLTSVANSLKP